MGLVNYHSSHRLNVLQLNMTTCLSSGDVDGSFPGHLSRNAPPPPPPYLRKRPLKGCYKFCRHELNEAIISVTLGDGPVIAGHAGHSLVPARLRRAAVRGARGSGPGDVYSDTQISLGVPFSAGIQPLPLFGVWGLDLQKFGHA